MKSKKPDQILITTIFALLVFGLVMISSAGIAISQRVSAIHTIFSSTSFFSVFCRDFF